MSGSGWRAVAVVALGALLGCRKGGGGAPPRAAALSLLPAETALVVSVDLARLRKAPILAKVAAANPFPAPLVAAIDALTAKTGVDPWRTFDSIVFAGASARRFALVARAPRLDRARLEAAAGRIGPGMKVFLPDERTLVMATPEWAQQIAALGAGGAAGAASAMSNAGLTKLCQSVSDHPIWGAAIVSERVRDEWLDDLQLQEAAYFDRFAVSLDVDAGVEGLLSATLTSASEADKLAEEIANWLVRARRGQPEGSMYEGLLKGLTTYGDGNTVHVSLSLGEASLIPWARYLSRYWRFVGAKLPAPSQRATPLRLEPSALSSRSAAISLGEARVFAAWGEQRYALVDVTNRSNRPVAPALSLMFRRQSGDMLGPGECFVAIGLLMPGEKAVCVGPAPTGAVLANYDVHLGDAKATEARTTLKVLRAQLGPPLGPTQWVAGRVRNESRGMVEHPRVHVSFYDAGGGLVGYGNDDLEGKPLLPGAEATFQASSMVLMPAAAATFAVTAVASK